MLELIKETAARFGFDSVATTSVDALTTDGQRFREWLDKGYHAGMAYMARNPELQSNPADLFDGARSIITLAISYSGSQIDNANGGRVARYAWGQDYHNVVKDKLRLMVEELERKLGRSIQARSFVDAVPLLERAAARRAGLGFQGKNTMLIRRRAGSYFFIAEILSNLELEDTQSIRGTCGTCTRCIEACPTSAITEPYQIDSNLCIAYLTIENREGVPVELRSKIGDWIFGCDICQEVCPFNRFASTSIIDEFMPQQGGGTRLDVVEILQLDSDDAFRLKFKRTPLLRAKRRGLVRNAIVVAGNQKCEDARAELQRISIDPSDPMLQEHAKWALTELSNK
jgi:epoxyqueuosine reductase